MAIKDLFQSVFAGPTVTAQPSPSFPSTSTLNMGSGNTNQLNLKAQGPTPITPLSVSTKPFVQKVVEPAKQIVNTANQAAAQGQTTPNNPYMMGAVNIGGTPTTGATTNTGATTGTTPTNTQTNPTNTTGTNNAGANTSGTSTSGTNNTTTNPLQTQLDASIAAQNAAQTKSDEELNKFRAGIQTFMDGSGLTPDQVNQLNAATQQWNSIIEKQKVDNQTFTSGTTNLGIASGRNRYAPEIETGYIQGTINEGNKRVADLEAKKTSALATMKQALLSDNAKLLETSYNAYTNAQQEKDKVTAATVASLREQIAAQEKAVNDAYIKEQDDIRGLVSDAAMGNAPAELILQAENLPYNQAAALLAPYTSAKAPGILGEYNYYKQDMLAAGKPPVPFADYISAADKADIIKTRIQEAGKSARTPGLGGGIGASGGTLTMNTKVPLTTQPAFQALRAAEQSDALAIDKLYDNLLRYRTLLNEKVGDSGVLVAGEDAAAIDGAYQSLLFPVAKVGGQGALQAPDKAVVEAMVMNPASIKSSAFNLATGRASKDAVLNSVDRMLTEVEEAYSRVGLQPSGGWKDERMSEGLKQVGKATPQEVSDILMQDENTVVEYGDNNPDAQEAILKMANDGLTYTQIREVLGI